MEVMFKRTLVLLILAVALLIAGLAAITVSAGPSPASTSYVTSGIDDDGDDGANNGGDDDSDDGGDDDSDDGRAPLGGVDTGGGGLAGGLR